MKLWQKIFLLTLVLVILVVNVTAYVLLLNNHQLAIEREQQSAATRHVYLVAELQNSITYEQVVERTFPLDDVKTLGVAREVLDLQRDDPTLGATLFIDGERVYSVNSQPIPQEALMLSEPEFSSRIVEEEGRTYLLVSSSIPLSERTYQLVTSFEITSTFDLFLADFDLVRVIGIVAGLVVAGILLVLVSTLLGPLRNLSATTRQIAGGDLEQRATVHGNDEVAEVALNLNTMADSIEHNVTELEKLAEARRVFIGNLAHEMKTPLTSILGFADLLRIKRVINDDERLEYANVIVNETKRLQSLSGKLMELLIMGSMELSTERVSVNALVSDLSMTMQPIMRSRSTELTCTALAHDEHIDVDVELVKSLLYNLIDNSIRVVQPSGTVCLTAAVEGETVVLAVCDDGPGIPSEQIPQLIEPFYMLDKARTRKHGGAGLGLALCAEIARAHHTELVITSTLGEGTTVQVGFKKAGDHG
ncbi:MAG: HAMP domain-containing histidine kinase [Coriobacteriales bacterium]|jgi:signal transduction histidine kinase|nr:HAMP domain-containing histidine kinase [Coriobacteriales bacterium]